MAGRRSLLLLVRSNSLLSLPGLLAFAILGLAPAVLLESVNQHGPLSAWALIGVLSTACALVILVVAASLVRRMRALGRVTPTVDSILTLSIIAGSAALKAMVLAALALKSPLAANVDITYRDSMLGRVMTQVVVVVVIVGSTTALVSSRREHRALRDRLARERRRLITINSSLVDQMRVAQEALREEAHLAIDPALAAIRIELESDPDEGSVERALAGLDEAVRTIVRPMSNRFAEQGADAMALVVDVPTLEPAQRWRQSVDVPAAVRPWLTSILLLVAGLVVGMAWRLPLAWYVFLVQSAAVWVIVLPAVRLAWPARFRRLPALVGFAFLVIVYAALFITTQLLFEVDDLGSVQGDATLLGSVYRIGAASAISGMAMAHQQRTETEAALQQVNASLLVQVSRLRRENWAIGRRMSLVMHGSVQSALISAMLLLREDSSAEGRQEVLMRLQQARAALDAETWWPGMLQHGLREIATLWGSLCAIEVLVEPGAALVIDDQPGIASCCVEVVREAVGNAVRHGGATQVAVTVTSTAEGVVTITAEDNGSGVSAEPRVGLGTRMLDEVCLSWARVSTGAGTVLSATIA